MKNKQRETNILIWSFLFFLQLVCIQNERTNRRQEKKTPIKSSQIEMSARNQ